jgi:phosphoribosylformylglycinamidine (FGAM) synthase PurS component
MNDFRRRTLANSVRNLVAELERHKIKIPADARAVLKQLDRLDADPVANLATADLVTLYVDGASAQEIDTMAERMLTENARREAWSEARIVLAKRVEYALWGNAEAITQSLRALAEPLIAKVEKAAAIPDHNVGSLLRDGQQDAAALVAELDLVVGDLNSLYALRDKLTRGADYGADYGIDCRRWRDPRKLTAALVGNSHEVGNTARFMIGVRAGAGLWFPTPSEAEIVARPIGREIAAERARDNQHRAGVVAFGR